VVTGQQLQTMGKSGNRVLFDIVSLIVVFDISRIDDFTIG